MSEAEKIKNNIIRNIHKLCAHCVNGNRNHDCQVKQISERIANFKGIPLIVNDKFRGMVHVNGR